MNYVKRDVVTAIAIAFITGCGRSDHDRGYMDGKRDRENSIGFVDKFSTGFQAGQGNPHETKEYNSGYYRAVTERK